MSLFNRQPMMPGMMPARRGLDFRTILLLLGIVFGLYFLNTTFLWMKIPALSAENLKTFNVVVGALLVLLGIMVKVRPRYY